MALKVEIKAGERIIIGDAVVTNQGHRARLFVEGDAPILREKDVLRLEDADTPCKRIYALVQLMYLSTDPRRYFDLYFESLRDLQSAAPSTMSRIDRVNKQILTGSYYKALKEAKALIAYERELLQHARGD